MNISSAITISDTPPYLAEARALQSVAAGFLPADNAEVKNASGTTTSYGLLKAGTILAKAADGSVHPCGLAALTAVTTATLIATLGAVHQANFFVGDEVKVISQRSTIALAVTGEADDETFTTVSAVPHGLVVGDKVTLSGLTGGTGIAAGEFFVLTVPSLTTFTLSATFGGSVAAFTTDITAGTATVALATPRALDLTDGARYITAINRTTGAITLSGAVFTAAIGDLLVKTKAYKPCGILDRNVSTLEYGPDHSTVAMGKTVPIRHEGTVRQGFIFGLSAAAKIALSGAPYADPLAPATIVQPECAGFLFRNL